MIDSRIKPLLDVYMKDPFFRFIGCEIEVCAAGKCRLVLNLTDRILNPVGKVHGGIINALCTFTSSLASMSIVEEGSYTSASDFNISVFKNVSSGVIICEGTVLRSGKRLIFVETIVKTSTNELLAVGRVTKAVLVMNINVNHNDNPITSLKKET